MVPVTSDRNFTPSSTALESPLSTCDGIVVAPQMLHGQDPGGGCAAAVVNDQVKFAVIAFPARSFTPPLPPVISAVYVVEVARAAPGKNDAVPLLYVTVPDTATLPGANNLNVRALTVVGSSASL